ncbi:MAG: hypothetical protein Q7T07_13540 [Burkholderiaceae bacterium]|nr:hypothetical protein [Burkholderiaceae bacterium]
MNISREMLMAFADGELDPVQRGRIELALRDDAALRQRVAALQAQRQRLTQAFDTVLDEPAPDRLTSLLKTVSVATPMDSGTAVVNLADVRTRSARLRGMPSWVQWGGMAASVVLGVLLGTQIGGQKTDTDLGLSQGQLLAGGAIAQALTTQLASEPRQGASVAVQLSFVDKRNGYCRTFSTRALAGLACQYNGQWVVQQVATVDEPSSGPVRQAATTLPRSILDAVDQRMADTTLDAKAERQARDRGWRR